MTGLPASIESYLVESGFSATELLILRHALGGEALTLRELATKTGKSTGVLDQASKKLLSRQILSKEKVNGVPKYTVDSVQAISRWVQRDSKIKKEVITRKEQDFQKFIDSLKIDSSRPRMEYFEGRDGVLKAYMRLLDTNEREMLQFMPMVMKEEEDPLKEFRIEYFRERKRRKIFLRSIGHNSPLGRRFQSRDHFEFRETILVPEQSCPITFEKIIIGDTIACFNHAEERACFIHYAELAQAEKEFFRMTALKEGENSHSYQQQKEGTVPVSTLTLSGLRRLFLSRRGFLFLAASLLISGILTLGMYLYTISLMQEQLTNRLMSIAATAAPEILAEDLQNLNFARDMRTEEYQRVFTKLNEIRNSNENVKFVYIIRKSSVPNMVQFVADADSNYYLPDPNDENPIEVVAPGTYYDGYFFEHNFAENIFSQPIAEKGIVHDKWGTYLSASAPIYDKSGKGVAILGLDMDISDFYNLTQNRFKPWLFFFSLFFLVAAIRLILISKYT